MKKAFILMIDPEISGAAFDNGMQNSSGHSVQRIKATVVEICDAAARAKPDSITIVLIYRQHAQAWSSRNLEFANGWNRRRQRRTTGLAVKRILSILPTFRTIAGSKPDTAVARRQNRPVWFAC